MSKYSYTYQVGDKVRILSGACGGDSNGDVFIIDRIGADPCSQGYPRVYHGDLVYFYREIELVESVSKPNVKGSPVLKNTKVYSEDEPLEFVN